MKTKLHSTGRGYLPPPPPRASLRIKGSGKTLLDEIRELPEEKCCLADGTCLKEAFVQYVEQRWDEATNKPRAMFRWTARHEAWVDFILEWKHGLPRAA